MWDGFLTENAKEEVGKGVKRSGKTLSEMTLLKRRRVTEIVMRVMRSMRFKSENEKLDKMFWMEEEKHAKRSCEYV